MSDPRAVDAVAIGTGSLAAYGQLAGHLAPILSVLFLLLSIAWLLWRMVDRALHGHPKNGEDDE